MKKGLLLIDIQNDFLPGGTLEVPEGDEVIPVANAFMEQPFDLIVATKDWHSESHGSFAATHGKLPGEVIDLYGIQQVLWPVHCVQGTFGAEFHLGLHRDKIHAVIHKGTDPHIDSYSAFFDNQRRQSTGLHELLQRYGISHLSLLGLATDYCVKYSACDALSLGYEVAIVASGCRGVDLRAGDSATAFELMKRLGATIE